ncbi:MAG: RND transporter [Thiotrichales bacterium]
MNWLRNTPTILIALVAVFLGLAPFVPEPHLVEKLRMLSNGELVKPIDIFDLLLHTAPIALLVVKVIWFRTPQPPTRRD